MGNRIRGIDRLHMPLMPRETQKQAAWLVQNYPRYVIKRNEILTGSRPAPEIYTKTNTIADPTGQTVARLEAVTKIIDAVESSIKLIDKGYRQGVWDKCVLGKEYPCYAADLTWKYYKNDFLFYVAAQLNMPLDRDISENEILRYSHIPESCLNG